MDDLFRKLMDLTGGKEDLFTACFAATLQENANLAKDVARILLCSAGKADIIIQTTEIKIDTQQILEGHTNSCIDMIMTINGQVLIGIENKLFSPEGPSQLQKYLTLQIDYLAFITGDLRFNVSEKVLQDVHYLKGSNGRDHFLWQDFYEVLKKNSSPKDGNLDRLLLNLFERFGFSPPHPRFQDLNNPDREIAEKNQMEVAKLWDQTMIAFNRKGWKKIERASKVEVYISDGPIEKVKRIWLDPIWIPGSLRMRVSLSAGADLEPACSKLEKALKYIYPDISLKRSWKIGKNQGPGTLDIIIPMKELFNEMAKEEEMSNGLMEFTIKVHDLIREQFQ